MSASIDNKSSPSKQGSELQPSSLIKFEDVSENTTGSTLRSETSLENSFRGAKQDGCLINRLSMDVLSLIFELCGQIDWMNAVRISSVCRFWRRCIHSTPCAWSFLNLGYGKKPPDIRRYLSLSSQAPLHASLDDDLPVRALSGEMHRLHCLSLSFVVHEDGEKEFDGFEFPSLRMLIITAPFHPSSITTKRFPVLEYLVCGSGFEESTRAEDIHSFPNLKTLNVFARGDWNDVWIEVVRHCRESLISLRVFGAVNQNGSYPVISLPRLQYLQAYCCDWSVWSSFRMPQLCTYVEGRTYFHGPPLPHDDIDNVEEARFDGIDHIYIIPQSVRKLQIDVGTDKEFDFLSESLLKKAYPNLRVLEIRAIGQEEWLRERISQFTLPESVSVNVIEPWFSGLSGIIRDPGVGIVCSS